MAEDRYRYGCDGVASKPLALDRQPQPGPLFRLSPGNPDNLRGSAPSVAAQRVRGIEEVRIKLGCAQPGEVPALFATPCVV